jgi:hypothetical protein
MRLLRKGDKEAPRIFTPPLQCTKPPSKCNDIIRILSECSARIHRWTTESAATSLAECSGKESNQRKHCQRSIVVQPPLSTQAVKTKTKTKVAHVALSPIGLSCPPSSRHRVSGAVPDLANRGSGHRCAGSSAKGERHIGTPPPLGGASLAERRGRDNISSGKSSAALAAAAAAAGGGGYVAQPPPQTTVADSRTSNRGGKAVSMLARRLKLMGQRDTWSGKLDGGLR